MKGCVQLPPSLLSLLLGVISYYEDSPSVASVFVDPIACTLVSWEGGWEYSSITICSSCSSDDGYLWTCSSELECGGVTEPLSTTICGGDGGVRSRPCVSGGICVQPSYCSSLVEVYLILSPINSVPIGMKSKFDIEKISSPSSLFSSTHYYTSSSEEESSNGST